MLRPLLHDRLRARLGEPKITHENEAFNANMGDYGGRYSLNVVHYGEVYRVCCPFCGDTTYRLWINHLWGYRHPHNGSLNLWLAWCYNETECMRDPANRKRLYDEVFEDAWTGRSPLADDIVLDGEMVNFDDMPNRVLPPGELFRLYDLNDTHPARQYMKRRGYDPDIFSRELGVAYCPEALPHFRMASGRLIIPVVMNGDLVGWQARLIRGNAGKGNPKYYCVPTDHEILTRRGWCQHRQLVMGEEVLAYDGLTGRWRWEPLLGVHVFPFNGQLLSVERSHTGRLTKQFQFTEDHRWPVRTQRGKYKVVRGCELNTNTRFIQSGRYEENASVLSPRHAAILGWLITDGSALWSAHHWNAYVAQSEKKHLEELVALLGTKPRPVGTPGAGVFGVPVVREDRALLRRVCPSREALPSVACRLSTEAAEAMWRAMFLAEGSVSQDGQAVFGQYVARNAVVMEVFQILSVLTGRLANINTTYDNHHEVRMICTISAGRPLAVHTAGGVCRRPYAGEVWCPETPSGTWLMRHHGHVVVTGNTMPGMQKSKTLYNYDQAQAAPFIVVTEGPTKVWTFGREAVALMGNDASGWQTKKLAWWGRECGKPIIVLLDGNAQDSARALYDALGAVPKRVLVPLDEGVDAGDIPTTALRALVFDHAARAGIRLP